MRLVVVVWICLSLLSCKKSKAKIKPTSVAMQSTKKVVSSSPKRLTFLTYNVLADSRSANVRIPALMKLLKQSKADVIALQEVTAWFLNRLEKEKWVSQYTKVGKQKGRLAPGGLFILSKFPIKEHHYEKVPSRQGRGFLMATLKLHHRSFSIGTVHLESPLNAGTQRVAQIKVAFSRLSRSNDSVLLGDFNFGDGEQPDTQTLPNIYIDPWPMLHPKKAGFTWDMERSDMAKKGSFEGEKSRRIDRILLRSTFWRPTTIKIIGDQPVVKGNKELFPSDHFGLIGSFERQEDPTRK